MKKKQHNQIPPSGTLPATWKIKGVNYTIQSVDTQKNIVEISRDDNNPNFFVQYDKIRERLKIHGKL